MAWRHGNTGRAKSSSCTLERKSLLVPSLIFVLAEIGQILMVINKSNEAKEKQQRRGGAQIDCHILLAICHLMFIHLC